MKKKSADVEDFIRASGEKSEEELAEIEKLEHSFRQVLAYDETFKEIFKGGGK